MTPTIKRRLAALGKSADGRVRTLSGGDSGAALWFVEAAEPFVVKRDSAERVRGEAEGLRALGKVSDTLRVPRVLAEEGDLLVLEALDDQGPRDGARLGEGLRQLHVSTRDTTATHGWPSDNACGATPQPNAPANDGRVFQRERRLLPLIALCDDKGLLDARLKARLERIAETLETWLEDTPPSLVHGDLWSGNVMFTASGPAMIDPAVYRHYPDVDVAMLTLFGQPGEAFFEAYWDGAPPADWTRREALFQLYPLLNHLALFGGGYRAGVARAAGRVLED
ncbi:fructosamine kinase family protein [Salinicola aestuarinus]|uniref:fructosamine kinase family protein n=1 Tax=Salinicola aestuarinus TaxID=1949082 RepID=UPI000DA1D91A|nr:fructosamine kinase family protein [Salinicola aestuarinus]